MKEIKIKCPAKINLDLRVFKKDEATGLHPIKSIMQTISLFDFLTIKVDEGDEINLSGTSSEIPYDETNLCYKAAKLFLEATNKKAKIDINIEKNIPVCAGLAGGSTNAAGTLYGLNKLFDNPLDDTAITTLAISLGSDVNFCLKGGTKLCTGVGEKMINMPFYNFKLSLMKPKFLKVPVALAYELFDELNEESTMRNDLEFALLRKGNFPEIHYMRGLGLQMSGSGPTFFLRDKNIKFRYDKKNYEVYNDLVSVDHGSIEV